MPFLIIAGIIILVAIITLPQIWIQQAMARHGKDRADFPGTGGELAAHLLTLADLKDVIVEETGAGQGDHYDPRARAVRLSSDILHGRSVTAVAVAAHEVSHAIQHRDDHSLLLARIRMSRPVQTIERVAGVVLASAPFVFIFVKSPALVFLQLGVCLLLLCARLGMHVVTLPVEYDASFNKALPILIKGGFLSPEDYDAAKTVLLAAAFTYVAAALMSLLDLTRLVRVFR